MFRIQGSKEQRLNFSPKRVVLVFFCIVRCQTENDRINVLCCAVLCRVMAQVSCELVAPKESRPNEGILFFNIELSPMASPAFEAGR